MTVRLLVGNVRDRIREIPDGSVDLVAGSPPFWNLRDYGGEAKNDAEMGSEDTPAEFLDALLSLTGDFRRVLAPHGSIAIELGDSYFGSGGAGGDYNDNGLREGQSKFRQKRSNVLLPKSLCMIPTLYPASLAYGWNMLNPDHRFDRWRVRNVVVWARPNPPVGALGDKVRPATSYITVACTSAKRWFDLDAVRSGTYAHPERIGKPINNGRGETYDEGVASSWSNKPDFMIEDRGGAPPLDWWDFLTDRIDAALRQAAKGEYTHADLFGGETVVGKKKQQKETAGGKLVREAWEAGEIEIDGFYPITTQGFKGAHYATWPETLAARLIKMLCPLRVCTVCGEPSRRIVGKATYPRTDTDRVPARLAMSDGERIADGVNQHHVTNGANTSVTRQAPTLGWSDCGHNNWRAGAVCDPFAGSGTTLAVAQGLGRDATGIELYPANADLVRQRVGMFLTVDEGVA